MCYRAFTNLEEEKEEEEEEGGFGGSPKYNEVNREAEAKSVKNVNYREIE